MSRRRKVFHSGTVHARRRMCDTCIFKPGNVANLRPGVLDMIVRDAVAVGGCIPCHETLDGQQSICAGFHTLHPTAGFEVAGAMGVIKWTD